MYQQTPTTAAGPPPAGRRSRRLLLVAVIAVVLAGAGLTTYLLTSPDEPHPFSLEGNGLVPGDCVKPENNGNDDRKLDCADPAAVFQIALELPSPDRMNTASCPTDDYVGIGISGRYVLCLVLNVTEGDCVEQHFYAYGAKKERCGPNSLGLEVTKVDRERADRTICDTNNPLLVRVYQERNTTICLRSRRR